jgi:hypothetical protein
MPKGGKMKISSLKQFIEASYKYTPNELFGYTLDKQLSTQNTKVYWDDVNNRGILSEKPTNNISDILADVTIAVDFTKKLYDKLHPRFRTSWATYDKVEIKYNLENFVAIGYSLGAYILSDYKHLHKFKEAYLVALPVVPGDILNKKDLSSLNITSIKSPLDPVGLLGAFTKDTKRKVDIPALSYNPAHEHQIKKTFPRLDQDMEVGDPIIITGGNYKKMKVSEIKGMIKKLRKGKATQYQLVGKKKSDLIAMLTELINDADKKPRKSKNEKNILEYLSSGGAKKQTKRDISDMSIGDTDNNTLHYLTVKQLRELVVKHNLHYHIKGYYKMNKKQLLENIKLVKDNLAFYASQN